MFYNILYSYSIDPRGKVRHLVGCPSGVVRGEEGGVHLVHSSEITYIRQQHLAV